MFLGIDQGTTGTTAIVYDRELEPQAQGYAGISRQNPEPGIVELDPWAILESVERAVAETVSTDGVDPKEIDAVGLANQGETSLCWNADGEPLYDAIVWQDRRTSDRCLSLQEDEQFHDYVTETTGLRVDPYFSATKLEWLIDHVEQPPEDCYWGTTDTWLLWQLVEGEPYVTDHATASRTMLFDIDRLDWDERLLNRFGLADTEPPKPKPTDAVLGSVASTALGSIDAPVAGCIVDQQSALYGQGCHRTSDLKCTYGTGSFLLMNAGNQQTSYDSGVLGTVGWTIDGETTYAYDGGVYTTGAFIDWLVDSIEILNSPSESESLAREVESTGGVHAIPALTGLAAPYWDSETQGAFLGLDSSTERPHMVRAALEGIVHRIRDVVDAMQQAVGEPLGTIKVDGGLTNNDFLLEYQATVLDESLAVSAVSEATSLGTAILAANATDHAVDKSRLGTPHTLVEPVEYSFDHEAHYQKWHDAVDALRSWHHDR